MATKQTKTQANVPAVQEQTTAIAFSQEAPAYLNQGKARGSEEVSAKDMVLPRLELVQSQSPIKDENEDAKEGYLFNSVTQEIYGDLVYFVPVYYKLEYLVWKDKEEGGGFFGSYATDAEAQARRKEVIEGGEDPDFIEVVDTPVQYGLRVTPEGKAEQIVISMAKSKAKVSRKWNSMIQIVGGDRFSRVYKISSFKDENNKGQKFYNFTVQPAGFCPESIYKQAEELYEVLKTSDYRVAHETVIDNEGESASEDRGNI